MKFLLHSHWYNGSGRGVIRLRSPSSKWLAIGAGILVSSASLLFEENRYFLLLVSVAGPLLSFLVHRTRQGGLLTPVPAVCIVVLISHGTGAAALATAGTLLTGFLCHWSNRLLRNLFLSYVPSVILILLAGSQRGALVFLTGGVLFQIASIYVLEGISPRTALILGAGWVINAIAAGTVLFFHLEDGLPGSFVVVSVLVLFAAIASRTGRQLATFSGRIGTLSLQNRLISYLYRSRNPYPLYFYDGNQVWTMQGRPAARIPPPAELKKDPDNDWSVFPVGTSAFLAAGVAAESMKALRGRELRETLLLLESIWRASFAKRRMENAFLGAAAMLVRIADRKDSDTHRHSIRVSQTAVKLGEIMGLPDEELLQLRVGAMLHDIGKLAIPGNLLKKKKLLTEQERGVIETHPAAGARLLAPMERYGHVSSVVLQHHERIDGTGYPLGLRGSEISLHARIVAVADSFDAIISPRSYHLGKPAHIAMREIVRHRGTRFDARVVDALEEMLS